MKIKILLSLILSGFFLLPRPLSAQVWLKDYQPRKSTPSNMNFYDIQKAFDAYWSKKAAGGETITEEENGWAPFKRWEFFMEPRVYPSGNTDLPSIYPQIQWLRSVQSLPATWKSLGPDVVPNVIYKPTKSGAGRINTIAFHPTNPFTFWIGAPSGGIWKTTNGGQSWETTTDELASIGISDIAVNPLNPNELYAVTGDGDAGDTYSIGIIRSYDGGATWKMTGIMMSISERDYFRRIIIDPQDTSILLATSNHGIYRTTDGFTSGSIVRQGSFRDLEYKPGDFSIIYATSYDVNGDASIFRSTDQGKTFNVTSTGLNTQGKVNRIELAVTPANPAIVYALASAASDDGFYGLYKSANSGQTWTAIYDQSDPINLLGWELAGKDKGGQGWYDLSMAVSPTSENTLMTGGVNIWKSTTGGSSFSITAHWIGSPLVAYVHADHHMLKYNPLNNRLYSCNDGGIYYSPDNGRSWTDLSDGLTILQIYRTATTDAVHDLYLTGNQDNGSILSSGGNWQQVTGGDGMECAIDPNNHEILYTSYYNGNFYKSTDGGVNFNPIGPTGQPGSGAWITPFLLENSSPVFTGYADVYQSPDAGTSWLTLSDGLTGGTNLRSMAVASSDHHTIYAATYTSILVSRNGGISWDDISAGLPQQAIMSIEVSPNNPEKLWVALSGFADNEKVYRSTDGGTSWENYSDGLPNIPCNVIKYKNPSDDALYLGADIGVFYRDNSMSTWQPFISGLPNVIINDLEIQIPYSRIVAGSYGRGLWSSDLYPAQNTMYAYIYTGNRNNCLDDSTTITIRTVSNPDSIAWNFNGEEHLTVNGSQAVRVKFTTPGVKNISAVVYKNGSGYSTSLDHYVRVVSQPELQGTVYGASSFHRGDEASLLAYGAETYSWQPSGSVTSPDAAMTLASPDSTTRYVVTGTLGNCSATDTVTIIVRPGPVNDDVCSATPLQNGMNGPFTNVNASVQPGEPMPDTTDCNTQITWCNEGGLQHTVWFSYEATSSSSSFVTSGFDTQIALYSADACEAILNGGDTLIAANDDFFGADKQYAAAIDEAPLTAGKRYWIQVDGSAGGAMGIFYINIYDAPVGIGPEQAAPEKVRIYPNPGTGEFTVDLHGITGQVTLRVIAITGAVVDEETFFPAGDELQHKFTITEKGVYIISISGAVDHVVKRVVVE